MQARIIGNNFVINLRTKVSNEMCTRKENIPPHTHIYMKRKIKRDMLKKIKNTIVEEQFLKIISLKNNSYKFSHSR